MVCMFGSCINYCMVWGKCQVHRNRKIQEILFDHLNKD
jgi:hypothetical protein